MKEKYLYSKDEREIIERQFTNYFLKSFKYIRSNYYKAKNRHSKKVGEILTGDIENEYFEQIKKNHPKDTIICQLAYNINIDYIDNEKLYKILSEFTELDMKVLNLLIVNGNTQKEIAEHLKISQPRVSAIKKKYLKSLKN